MRDLKSFSIARNRSMRGSYCLDSNPFRLRFRSGKAMISGQNSSSKKHIAHVLESLT
jgi:hypothetical protein